MTDTLGAFVRAHRERLGLNQTELAERADVPRETVNRLEQKKTSLPMADTRRRLAAALGVSHLEMLVAAGEINQDELGSTAGIVEEDQTDPRYRLHEAMERTPMTPGQIEGLIQMFQAWQEDARRRPR